MEYNEPPLLLRGGTGTDLAIRKEEFVNLFADMFDTLLYKELRTPPFSQSIDHTYTDNRTFWNDALSGLHFESMRVRLEGFHLTEWLPSAPGRYFTLDAKASREEARRNHIIPDGSEYDPHGKESMVLGGVGSVRLKSKYISSYNTYFLGASSTGISHQGIPVALRETEYRQVIQEIKENGGCLTNLIGTLQILPASLSLIHYDRKVPRYCLIIESIEVIRASSPSELLATVAITFSGGLLEWQSQSPLGAKLWSFCSFFPGPLFLKRNYKSLDEAVDWLESYANTYSCYQNASILTDFDEHYQHFNIPVEFPLSQLFSDKINVDLIDFYTKKYGIIVNIHKLNEINIDKRRGTFVDGDQINMTGTFQNVNVKSQLSNATQSINALSNADQATKDELLRLTDQLNELLQLLPAEKAADAEKVSKRVEALMKEAQQPDPDKDDIKYNIDKLKQVATGISQIVPAVLPVVIQIATYISNLVH